MSVAKIIRRCCPSIQVSTRSCSSGGRAPCNGKTCRVVLRCTRCFVLDYMCMRASTWPWVTGTLLAATDAAKSNSWKLAYLKSCLHNSDICSSRQENENVATVVGCRLQHHLHPFIYPSLPSVALHVCNRWSQCRSIPHRSKGSRLVSSRFVRLWTINVHIKQRAPTQLVVRVRQWHTGATLIGRHCRSMGKGCSSQSTHGGGAGRERTSCMKACVRSISAPKSVADMTTILKSGRCCLMTCSVNASAVSTCTVFTFSPQHASGTCFAAQVSAAVAHSTAVERTSMLRSWNSSKSTRPTPGSARFCCRRRSRMPSVTTSIRTSLPPA